MTGSYENDQPQLLDRYIDGLLDPSERAGFERRLQQDRALRGQLEQQRRIDEALQRLLAPPDADRLLASLPPRMRARTRSAVTMDDAETRAGDLDRRNLRSGKARPFRRREPLSRRLAVAAILLLGAFGVWRTWTFLVPSEVHDPYAPRPWQSLEDTYYAEALGEFTPDWVCENDREFARAFRQTIGQPLLLSEPPEGVEALGLAYRNTISPLTVVLLGRARGEPILVFADRIERDAGQSVDPDTGLNLFQRTIGELVLYELSPLPRPYLLDLFYQP